MTRISEGAASASAGAGGLALFLFNYFRYDYGNKYCTDNGSYYNCWSIHSDLTFSSCICWV